MLCCPFMTCAIWERQGEGGKETGRDIPGVGREKSTGSPRAGLQEARDGLDTSKPIWAYSGEGKKPLFLEVVQQQPCSLSWID